MSGNPLVVHPDPFAPRPVRMYVWDVRGSLCIGYICVYTHVRKDVRAVWLWLAWGSPGSLFPRCNKRRMYYAYIPFLSYRGRFSPLAFPSFPAFGRTLSAWPLSPVILSALPERVARDRSSAEIAGDERARGRVGWLDGGRGPRSSRTGVSSTYRPIQGSQVSGRSSYKLCPLSFQSSGRPRGDGRYE